jgi:hypothetical protein
MLKRVAADTTALGCRQCRVPLLQWDDATAAKMHADAEQPAEDEQKQEELEMPGA